VREITPVCQGALDFIRTLIRLTDHNTYSEPHVSTNTNKISIFERLVKELALLSIHTSVQSKTEGVITGYIGYITCKRELAEKQPRISLALT
jgi:hypothetical protein